MPPVDKAIVRHRAGRKREKNLTQKTLLVLALFFGLGVYVAVTGREGAPALQTTRLVEQPRQAASAPSKPKPAIVQGVLLEHASLRKFPSAASQVVTVVAPGAEVQLTGQSGEWVQARLNSFEGWLPAEVVFSTQGGRP
jgi:SH3-like domain-containing protein